MGRRKMSYDISDTNADDDDGVIEPTIEMSKAKARAKAKPKTKPKAKRNGPKKTQNT